MPGLNAGPTGPRGCSQPRASMPARWSASASTTAWSATPSPTPPGSSAPAPCRCRPACPTSNSAASPAWSRISWSWPTAPVERRRRRPRQADIAALRDGGPYADTALPDITAHPARPSAPAAPPAAPRSSSIPGPGRAPSARCSSAPASACARARCSWSPAHSTTTRPFLVALRHLQRASHRRHGAVRRRPRDRPHRAPPRPVRLPRAHDDAAHRPPAVSRRATLQYESIFVTAAPCPPWLKHRWIELTAPEKIIEAFGSSEAAGACLIRGDEWQRHPGSVGKPSGSELKILDEEFREVPRGEVGEISSAQPRTPRPPTATSAPRRRRPRPTASSAWVTSDGWMPRATFSSPTAASTSSSVAAPTSTPPRSRPPSPSTPTWPTWPWSDPARRLGKTVHAIIEPRRGAALDEAACAPGCASALTAYKLPESYEFMPDLPRDQSGKIRRSQLARERESLGTKLAS